MQKHFKTNVVKLLDEFPRLNSLDIKNKLGKYLFYTGFASWSFNPCEVSWIGCSIGASIRNIEHLSLKKSEFTE